MRFTFITDIHLADSLGNYRRDCLGDIIAKLRYVVEQSAARGSDVILVGGDWFNSPKLGYPTQSAMLDVIDEFPCWVGVLGQHDVHGHELATARHSPAGALLRESSVQILDSEIAKVAGVRILGFSYHDDIVAVTKVYDTLKAQPDITIYHALIEPRSTGQFTIDASELPHFGALALCGDYHQGFLTCGVNGTLYANPGALTRTTPSDADRKPVMLLGKVEDGEARFTDELPIPCRPADEAFDLERWLSDKAHEAELADRSSLFAEAVKSLGEVRDDAMEEIIVRLGVDHPAAVVKRALSYLRSAEESAV